MNSKEFIERYYLHDSLLDKISFNELTKEAILTIEFCNWMQDNFVEGDTENTIIEVIFQNVSIIESYDFYCEGNSILECRLITSEKNESGLEIICLRDYPNGDNDVDCLKIFAESITVKEIS